MAELLEAGTGGGDPGDEVLNLAMEFALRL